MKIFDGIKLFDLGIYARNTLVFTDFHIGYEEALNKQGILMPRFQFREIIQRLDSIFKRLKNKRIGTIVVLGDLKHEFGTISEQEWRHTLRLLDYLGQHCKEIILIKGNHDTILGPIARKRNVQVLDYYVIEPINKRMPITGKANKQTQISREAKNKNSRKIANITHKALNKLRITGKAGKNHENPPEVSYSTLKGGVWLDTSFNRRIFRMHGNKVSSTENAKHFLVPKMLHPAPKSAGFRIFVHNKILCLHGDKIPPKGLLEGVSTIIMGHEHPAVSIKDGPRAETFKCFLIGKWKGKNLVVVPAFNLVTEGTDIMKEKVLSPFLKGNLKDFNVVVAADKLYRFGKVKDL